MHKETFIPEDKTLYELFNCAEIYKIPDYQRQYTWGDDELDQLWEDLTEAYQNQSENESYFLGSIVVVENSKLGFHELIDGQQRITTLMILLLVLAKNFPDLNKNYSNSDDDPNGIYYVDNTRINNLIWAGQKSRLTLQAHPNYDADFDNSVVSCEDFSTLKKPARADLKKDEPIHRYINAAYFFYDRLSKLDPEYLDGLINFIFFRVVIIKIVCHDESFAIKLFQVLNDRGLDLSNSDLIKTYLYSKYANLDDGPRLFDSKWGKIESTASEIELKLDDLMVAYVYYRLGANPRHQLSEEFKKIVDGDANISQTMNDLIAFTQATKAALTEKDPYLYSLRYVPWRIHILADIATAYRVDYEDKTGLFQELCRFYYLSYISGYTLGTIKQTVFNLISDISKNVPLKELKKPLEKLISSKQMVERAYLALDGDVYNENFLKPLLLSVEYTTVEGMGLSFVPIDRKLHADHIVPQAYKKLIKTEWSYLADCTKEIDKKLNTIGNMALLYFVKNGEALNHGFDKKVDIYEGLDKENTGVVAFATTRKVITDARTSKNHHWTESSIDARKDYLMAKIEKFLQITRPEKAGEKI